MPSFAKHFAVRIRRWLTAGCVLGVILMRPAAAQDVSSSWNNQDPGGGGAILQVGALNSIPILSENGTSTITANLTYYLSNLYLANWPTTVTTFQMLPPSILTGWLTTNGGFISQIPTSNILRTIGIGNVGGGIGSGNGGTLDLNTILGISGNMAAATAFSQWAASAGLTGNEALAEALPFLDRVPNLLRYAMNLGTSGQAVFLPKPEIVTTADGNFLTITYRQRKSMADIILVPQYSNDMQTWTDVPADDITSLTDEDANTARYQASVPIPAGQLVYLRVVARPNSGPVTQWGADAGGNGHYYQAVALPGRLNWADAQAYAEAQGGYLATITSDAENSFVFGLINHPQFWIYDGNNAGPYIGGFQPPNSVEPAGGWTWVNNEGPVTYANWAPGQPDNSGGTEDRIHFWSSGGPGNRQPTWNDTTETWAAPSLVIEWDSDPSANNPSP